MKPKIGIITLMVVPGLLLFIFGIAWQREPGGSRIRVQKINFLRGIPDPGGPDWPTIEVQIFVSSQGREPSWWQGGVGDVDIIDAYIVQASNEVEVTVQGGGRAIYNSRERIYLAIPRLEISPGIANKSDLHFKATLLMLDNNWEIFDSLQINAQIPKKVIK